MNRRLFSLLIFLKFLELKGVSTCPPIPEVQHASSESLAIFSTGLAVKFTCDEGYIMDGDATIICNNGFWLTSPPSCKPRPVTACDSGPCHPTALCSPKSTGFLCQCKAEEIGDPYGAGCIGKARFNQVVEPNLRALCGFKPPLPSSSHVSCGSSVRSIDSPWQGVLMIDTGYDFEQWCGAVVITRKHILSAAHCFESEQCNLVARNGNNRCEPKNFKVFFGRTNATVIYPEIKQLEDENSEVRDIHKIFIHPQWQYSNPISNGHDIAVFTVTQELPLSHFIKPTCLPNPAKHFLLHKSDEIIQITGFGRNDSDTTPLVSSVPHRLQLISMKIIDKLECDTKWDGQVSEDIFCTVATTKKEDCSYKPGSCKGDSGGPGVANAFGQYVVVGLISGGPSCGQSKSPAPHYMTSVAHNLPFILDHIEDLPCPPPSGSPIPPTCDIEIVNSFTDRNFHCKHNEDCPDGRCFEGICTLYEDDEDARLAKVKCTSSDDCKEGAFLCELKRCQLDKPTNGTEIKTVKVDGEWSSWSAYGSCSVTCGPGTKRRERSCNNPAPSHGGHDCSGQKKQIADCNLGHCPVDGEWSFWSAYGSCSVTCGPGTKRRERSCNNPEPAHGGHNCSYQNFQIDDCNLRDCPVDGGWSSWSPYGTCSVTCGPGTKRRGRTCTNPVPAHRGHICSGQDEHISHCNNGDCPGNVITNNSN